MIFGSDVSRKGGGRAPEVQIGKRCFRIYVSRIRLKAAGGSHAGFFECVDQCFPSVKLALSLALAGSSRGWDERG